MLKPASPGTGVIAGATRARGARGAGVQNVLTKCLAAAIPTTSQGVVDALRGCAGRRTSPQCAAARAGAVRPAQERAVA
jgi:ribosomal protein S5